MKEFLISLAIATLSGLGIGSGGLLVIYLTLVRDIPQLIAQGLNLLFFIFASSASVVFNFKRRRISAGLVLLMGSAGVLGAFWGTRLALIIDEDVTRKIFGTMLILSGISVFFKK